MKDRHPKALGRPRASEQKQPTNEKILHAATALFLANGYKEVSVDEVAKKCNVTKATVYYYYESKAALFTETMVQMMVWIRKQMQTMLEDELPLKTRLLNVAAAHLNATVDMDLDSFMREAKHVLTEQQTKKIQEAEQQMYAALEDAFIREIKDGEISNINPTFAAHTYASLLKVGNYKNADHKRIFSSTEETAVQIIRFFWNGLFYEE
ncbi:TetR/AcrR family transcriptional regulator [Radiobacillus sp. PE A8.2]|uniref:TetR/AcrR family transcriptional regulator n=1 Tax=Radiobacillus sp. PE A8.2 TaxID=3380349 RepID=UPI003890F591